MLFRTHLVITIFFIILIFPYIHSPIIFVPVALFATLLPDVDSPYSKLGHHKIFRPFNFFTKHRGITHSLIFLVVISFFISIFSKEILFAFVLGYASHIFSDCLTKEGVPLFYPSEKRIKGLIKTGGITEVFISIIFIFADLSLILRIFNIL